MNGAQKLQLVIVEQRAWGMGLQGSLPYSHKAGASGIPAHGLPKGMVPSGPEMTSY